MDLSGCQDAALDVRVAGEDRPVSVKDELTTWMKVAARYPLLDGKEEIELARRVQAGQKDDATAAEKRAGIRARNKLVESNTRLVASIAKRYFSLATAGHSALDMLQDGCIGLNRAAEMFDPTRGYKFSTYATGWVRQAIGRGLSDKGRTVRLPVRIGEQIKKVRRIIADEMAANGRIPSLEEIAAISGYELKEVRRLTTAERQVTSLDVFINDEEGATLADMIGVMDPEKSDELERYEDALMEIPEEDRIVLEAKRNGAKNVDIGNMLGLSRQSGCNRVERAISRIRKVAA